jgi:hypothetical protein
MDVAKRGREAAEWQTPPSALENQTRPWVCTQYSKPMQVCQQG